MTGTSAAATRCARAEVYESNGQRFLRRVRADDARFARLTVENVVVDR